MPAKINLLNQRFGKLLVIEETSKRKNKSIVWKCQCDCGMTEEYSTKELRSDGIQMCSKCGNKRQPKTNLLENIIGKKFANLVVLEKTSLHQGQKLLYKCQCDCGNITLVNRTDLLSGHTTTCGQTGCYCKLKYHIGDIINNKQIIGYGKTNNKGNYYYKVKCLLCGREYMAMGQSLEKTLGCGCQASRGEFIITQILIANNIKFATQYTFQDLPYKRYDFALLNDNNEPIRLIEFDGEQHYSENIKNSGWNTYSKYQDTIKSDKEKNIFALSQNIPLVRIPYWERENLNLALLLGDKYLIKD